MQETLEFDRDGRGCGVSAIVNSGNVEDCEAVLRRHTGRGFQPMEAFLRLGMFVHFSVHLMCNVLFSRRLAGTICYLDTDTVG